LARAAETSAALLFAEVAEAVPKVILREDVLSDSERSEEESKDQSTARLPFWILEGGQEESESLCQVSGVYPADLPRVFFSGRRGSE
jgi:hypothetical protein